MNTAYQSPLETYAGRPFSGRDLEIQVAREVTIGEATVATDALPPGLTLHPELGLVTVAGLAPQRLHGWPKPHDFAYTVRACATPGGELLAMGVVGTGQDWQVSGRTNEMLAFRSSDGGQTWQPPVRPWEVSYSQHGFNPLIPKAGHRIIAFGTELHPNVRRRPLSGALGIRTSDDEGHTWSPVEMRLPRNDPDMRGPFHMQGCETRAGTWLLGTYTIEEGAGPDGRIDHQYVMRSEDQGATWELLPGPRPGGWRWEPNQRMMEGRVLQGRGDELLLFTRVCEGHLWLLRSHDDGRTWSAPSPTPLVHPDAPPMVFRDDTDDTLIALIHNRPGGWFEGRESLWISVSADDGATWSEPSFLLANAATPLRQLPGSKFEFKQVSYADMVIQNGIAHVFFDHGCRQLVHVRLPVANVKRLPAGVMESSSHESKHGSEA